MNQDNTDTMNLEQGSEETYLCCDACGIELEIEDKEWVEPWTWQETYRCPSCESEIGVIITGTVSIRTDKATQARDISTAYVEGGMSDGALERSLNRVYGLRESTLD